MLRQIQLQMASGKLPGGALVDGVIILMAAALMVTPGLLTDIFGFLCLVPGIRGVMKRLLKRRFEKAIVSGSGNIFIDNGRGGHGPIG